MKDYYLVLGLARFATLQEIKKAYRGLALTHHPDRGGSQDKMVEINAAYEFLIKNKTQYDQALQRRPVQGFTIIVGGFGFYSETAGSTTSSASWSFTG